jgi:aspartyl protease family protein
MRSVISLAAAALAAAVIVPRHVMQTNAVPPQAATLTTRAAPPEAPPAYARSVTLPRNAQGHFQTDSYVDGRRLTFMVDTGASVVALTARDAAMLGIHPAERDFTLRVNTANGTVKAAPVELDRIEIADITMRNVTAMVLPDGALSDNLLGMSFLSRLHRWEFAGGRLVLEQ